ncbi:MAG: flippase-like domain-containing protein, partial [Elusimicrobia bacterium]|nr:flippase-like domain-containing protein [Elusimicrobiota bacterium]
MSNKRALIGLGIGAVCLYFALRGLHLHEVLTSLAQADYRWMFPAAVAYSVGFLFRTWRWQVLLSPLGAVAGKHLFAFLMIGFLANNLLPLRAGELVRAHLTGTRMRISRSATLATVLVERTCDGLSFAVLFLITTWFLPFPPVLRRSAWILAILCVAAFVVFHR